MYSSLNIIAVLLPMYKKLTVSDSTDIVIDIAAEILFNVNMLCACERFKFFG